MAITHLNIGQITCLGSHYISDFYEIALVALSIYHKPLTMQEPTAAVAAPHARLTSDDSEKRKRTWRFRFSLSNYSTRI